MIGFVLLLILCREATACERVRAPGFYSSERACHRAALAYPHVKRFNCVISVREP